MIDTVRGDDGNQCRPRRAICFGVSTFGWPLVIASALKGIYDLLLLGLFAQVRPPEEAD